ncbi:MAG: hypothetical protein QQN49_06140 [Nitrosopumilus sp.]
MKELTVEDISEAVSQVEMYNEKGYYIKKDGTLPLIAAGHSALY